MAPKPEFPCTCPTRTEFVNTTYGYSAADQVVTLRVWIHHEAPCPYAKRKRGIEPNPYTPHPHPLHTTP